MPNNVRNSKFIVKCCWLPFTNNGKEHGAHGEIALALHKVGGGIPHFLV